MIKFRIVFLSISIFTARLAHAQQGKADTTLTPFERKYLDSLDKELGALMESVTKPKSFADLSMTAATGYYDFKSPNNDYLNSSSHFTLLPSASYYHKSGLAFSATACGIFEANHVNFYQFFVSPSYAYTRNKYFSTGIMYAHYFTKDSLGFYTSPIDNEIFINADWKRGWLLPAVAVGYGWGTRQSFKKELVFLKALRLRFLRRGINQESDEKIQDLAVSFSLKHNFIWRQVLFSKAFLLITPQFLLTAATQQFGFTTTYSSGSHILTSNLLPSNGNLKTGTGLGWQSATFLLKADYSVGNFYFQPQLVVDYYIPKTTEARLHTICGILAGYNF